MPTKKRLITTVVLFEDEVRHAAKTVKQFYALAKDETASKDDQDTAFHSMCSACHVALYGADDDEAVLLLGRKPLTVERGMRQ